jgi:hypothetical protein
MSDDVILVGQTQMKEVLAMKASLSMLATVLVAGAVITAHAQQPAAGAQADSPTYAWHAELVSFDQAAKTLTVKAHIVNPGAAGELKNFKAGDRILLQWSGFDNSANGIRGFMKYDVAQSKKDRFLLPVELVSPTVQGDYVTLKLRAPDAAAAALQAVKPGEWVTITSKHRPAGDADQVVAVRPYVQSDRT